MELIELISGSGEKEANEADIENEDFNDNNIRYQIQWNNSDKIYI